VGLGFENVAIFYGNLEYFTNIWDILSPFGTFCVHLLHFFPLWCQVPTKIWQPWLAAPSYRHYSAAKRISDRRRAESFEDN
jgi:hypothetical protein